jgi:hypothetical protein
MPQASARPPNANATPARPAAPPVYRPQPTPLVLQRKEAVSRPQSGAPSPHRQTPQAPPAYRPQPTPFALQRKAAPGAQRPAPAEPPRTPNAPSVYRPQPAPRVLQAKPNAAQSSPNASQSSPKTAQLNARPSPSKPCVLQSKPFASQPAPRVLQLKAGAPVPSPFRGVIQRMQVFYVKHFDGTITAEGSVPDNHIRIGTHQGQGLYAPFGLVNPFTQTPWFKMDVSDYVPEDDETDEMKVENVRDFYQAKINKRLDKEKKRFNDEESSDSDDAVEDDDTEEEEKRRRARRFYKAGQLTAIVKSFFPLSPEEEQFRQDLKKLRKRDNKARPGKRQMYKSDTRESYARVGFLFEQTSFLHNPYLRRGFRAAVTKAKIKKGGSKAYETTQKNVRKKVLEVINKDDRVMKWTRNDFPDEQTWKAFNHLKKDFSNDSKKKPYSFRVESGEDTTGSTARVGFHHIAWKESESKAYEKQALNPVNLTALSDQRQILKPKKLDALKKKGLKAPIPGGHEAFGHEQTGFMQGDQDEFERATKGGHFKDLDTEGAFYEIKVVARQRKRKRDIYDPSVVDSLTTQNVTPTPNTTPKTTPNTTQVTPFVFQVPPNLTPTPVIQTPTIFVPLPTQNVSTSNNSSKTPPNKKRKVAPKKTQPPPTPPRNTTQTNTNVRRSTRQRTTTRRYIQDLNKFGLPKNK